MEAGVADCQAGEGGRREACDSTGWGGEARETVAGPGSPSFSSRWLL